MLQSSKLMVSLYQGRVESVKLICRPVNLQARLRRHNYEQREEMRSCKRDGIDER